MRSAHLEFPVRPSGLSRLLIGCCEKAMSRISGAPASMRGVNAGSIAVSDAVGGSGAQNAG